jgi:regulator of protease activity HflC (stomatin/prohibitin superfamily)
LVKVQTATAEGVSKLFASLHESAPTPDVLKYLYIQNLPKLAEGTANKLFIVPSELEGIATAANLLGAGFQQSNGDAPETPVVRPTPKIGQQT